GEEGQREPVVHRRLRRDVVRDPDRRRRPRLPAGDPARAGRSAAHAGDRAPAPARRGPRPAARAAPAGVAAHRQAPRPPPAHRSARPLKARYPAADSGYPRTVYSAGADWPLAFIRSPRKADPSVSDRAYVLLRCRGPQRPPRYAVRD